MTGVCYAGASAVIAHQGNKSGYATTALRGMLRKD
jgi:hypothetical protein